MNQSSATGSALIGTTTAGGVEMTIPDGLILWNKLDSVEEITGSAYGEGFTLNGQAKFVSGKFGDAVGTEGDNSYLTIDPASFFGDDLNQGTVELWINKNIDALTGYQTPLYGIFGRGYYSGQPGRATIEGKWGDGTTGPSGLYTTFWDTDNVDHFALDEDWNDVPTGQWVHVAFVWDMDGIDGSADVICLYRDGDLVGSSAGSGAGLTPYASPEVRQFTNHGYNRFGEPVAYMDNIKVWDVAKTDFSDRFVEGFEPDEGSDPFAVTTAEDVVDPNDGKTSLREAIEAANADPDANTITFAPGIDLVTLQDALPAIVEDLTIDGGTDADGRPLVTVDANADGDGVPDENGGYEAYGGGLFVRKNAILTNTTVTGNASTFPDNYYGSGGRGGGIGSFSGELTLTNSLIVGNYSTQLGGDIAVRGGVDRDAFSIVGGDATLVFAETVDNGPVKTGVLADNGGPTETIAILQGGLADGMADPNTATGTDQRGVARERVAPDLGAFELEQEEFDLVLLGSDGVADELIGEDGNDFLKGFGAVDFYDGGDGTDTLDLSTTNRDAVIDLAGGKIVFLNFAEETALNIENVVGTLGDNRIIGTGGDNEIDGEAGTDTVVYKGARGDYTVTEDEGVITVEGVEGTDTLTNIEFLEFLGDPPSNRILIGEDAVADALFGGDGNDFLRGLGGLDYHDGGAGEDTVDISHTGVAVVADLDAGTLAFANGLTEAALNIENLIATQGSDRIAGTAGDNVIDGQGGDDTVLYALAADQYDVGGPSGTGAFSVTGPDGTDTLTGIEFLNFADTGDIAVGDFLLT